MKRQTSGVLCPGAGQHRHRELELFAHLPCSMTGITMSSNVDRDHHDHRIEAMVTLDDLRTAQILLDGIAVRTPLFEWTSAADRRLQTAWRLQQGRVADRRRTPPRSYLVLQRQSRAGRGLCGASAGREG